MRKNFLNYNQEFYTYKNKNKKNKKKRFINYKLNNKNNNIDKNNYNYYKDLLIEELQYLTINDKYYEDLYNKLLFNLQIKHILQDKKYKKSFTKIKPIIKKYYKIN